MRSFRSSSVRVVAAATLAAAAGGALWPGSASPVGAQSSPSCKPTDAFNAVTTVAGDAIRVTTSNPFDKDISVQLGLAGLDGKALRTARATLAPGQTADLVAEIGTDVPAPGQVFKRPGSNEEWPIYGRTLRAAVSVTGGAGACTTAVSGVEVFTPQTGATRLSLQDTAWPIYG